MSLRNFVRRFKQATGDSPLAYLPKLRVATAQRLLESGQRTVQQISESVGYQDVAFLSRRFPSPYRCFPEAPIAAGLALSP